MEELVKVALGTCMKDVFAQCVATQVFDGVLFVSGRGRVSLRLLPLSALESGDVKSAAMKVADTEGMETGFYQVLEDLDSCCCHR